MRVPAIGGLYSVHRMIVRNLLRACLQIKGCSVCVSRGVCTLLDGSHVRISRVTGKIFSLQVVIGVSPTWTLGELKSTFIIFLALATEFVRYFPPGSVDDVIISSHTCDEVTAALLICLEPPLAAARVETVALWPVRAIAGGHVNRAAAAASPELARCDDSVKVLCTAADVVDVARGAEWVPCSRIYLHALRVVRGAAAARHFA